jgi:hypothetical protein
MKKRNQGKSTNNNSNHRSSVKMFTAFFPIEFKRFFRKRFTVILTLLMLFFSLLFIQIGAAKFKSILNHKQVFQQHEKQKVNFFSTYTQYGGYGYRILFVPAAPYVFFLDAGVSSKTTAFVDSGARLNIYNSLKGDNVFGVNRFQYGNFAGIILFFGSLLAVVYIFNAFKDKEYLKMLAAMAGHGRIFGLLMVSRAAVLFLVLTANIACALGLLMINQINIPLDNHFFLFLLMIILMCLFFFALGAAAANFKSRASGFITMASAWFILLFIVPPALQFYIQSAADHIKPVYKLEMETFKLLMEFEKQAIKKAGSFDYGKDVTEQRKEVILNYMKNEFKKIHSLEEKMLKQMQKYMHRHQWLSTLFPTTFYLSVSGELSGSGYHNHLTFYKYVQDSKKDFFKFFMDKIYFSEPKDGANKNFQKVESFIKGDGNIYPGTGGPAFHCFLYCGSTSAGVSFVQKIIVHENW